MRIFNLLFLILLLPAGKGFSAEYFSGRSYKVAFTDTLQQDLFAGCQEMKVYGYAAGDIYSGCETITIDGKVQDDVLVGCRTFKLTGIINDGLIVFAESITIDGTVRGDVMAFGKEVRLTANARLGGNLITGCGSFIQDDAPIAGFVKGGAGYAFLNGPVGESVKLEVKNIEFGDEYVSGDGTFITVPYDFDESTIAVRPADLELEYEAHKMFFQSTFFYWSFLAFLVAGIFMLLLFRNSSTDYVSFSGKNMGTSLGAGVIFMFVVPAVVTITSFFIVTIPAALIVLALYLILIYLSFVFSALQIGDQIWKMIKKPDGSYALYIPLLIGLVIICLTIQVPYFGWLFALFFICFGSGSLIMYIWHTKRNGNTVSA